MTTEDKFALLPRVEFIVSLASKAKLDGLLSLYEDLKTMPSVLLNVGIRHVVDGTDTALLTRLLDNCIEAARQTMTDIQLLERKLDRAGILGIRKAYSPVILKHICLSVLGEDVAYEVITREEEYLPYSADDEYENIQKLKRVHPTTYQDEDLELLIRSASLEALSFILFLLNETKRDAIVHGISPESRLRLYESRPTTLRRGFVDSLIQSNFHREGFIRGVQESVKGLLRLRSLARQGS